MTGKDLSGPPPEIRGLSVLKRMGSEPAAATGQEEVEPDFAFDEESGRISAVVKEAVGSDAEGVANDDEDEEDLNETNPQAETSTSRSPSPIAPEDLFASATRSSSLTA